MMFVKYDNAKVIHWTEQRDLKTETALYHKGHPAFDRKKGERFCINSTKN